MRWKDVAAATAALTGGAVTMNTVFGAPWGEVLPLVKAYSAFNDPNTQGAEKWKNVGKELVKDALIFGAAAALSSVLGAGAVAVGAGLLARPALRLLAPPLIELVGSKIAGRALATAGKVIGVATGVTVGVTADVPMTAVTEAVTTKVGEVMDKVSGALNPPYVSISAAHTAKAGEAVAPETKGPSENKTATTKNVVTGSPAQPGSGP